MKKIILLSALFVFGLTASAQQTQEKVKTEVKESKRTRKAKMKAAALAQVEGAGMVFETESIDYGTIEQDADGKRDFVFTNNGNKPLIIANAVGSCGCTVPTFPKEPIAPGAKAVISVKYDTHRVGGFQKNVTITSNASETPKTLTIKGTVTAKPQVDPAKAQEVKS